MTHAANPMTDDEDIEKMSEVFDAVIPRVDLVGRAANGTRFLFAKSDESPSLLDPATVAELVKRTEGEPMTDTATAPVETAPVTKADDVDLDVTKPLDESGVTPKDQPNVPGSPGWETVDADTAAKWVGILARARNAIATLATREDVETVAGVGDGMIAYELGEANLALDYAINVLATYGANEKLEADLSAEFEAVGKAIGMLAPETLDSIESSGSIVKAGRVLSAKNETLLRTAAENLNNVLAALPAAPESVEKKETPTVTDSTTTAEPEAPAAVAKAEPAEIVEPTEEPVEKAEALQAVFDQSGKLVGAVKPSQLIPLEGGGGTTDTPPAADEPTVDELSPAPAETVGTPTDASASEPVEKSEQKPDTDPSVEELVKSANDGEDPIAKALASIVTAQADEIELLKSLPARGGPIAHGAPMPTAEQLRGQTDGAGATAVAPERIVELRKQMQDAATPAQREQARDELNRLAAVAYAEVRASSPASR